MYETAKIGPDLRLGCGKHCNRLKKIIVSFSMFCSISGCRVWLSLRLTIHNTNLFLILSTAPKTRIGYLSPIVISLLSKFALVNFDRFSFSAKFNWGFSQRLLLLLGDRRFTEEKTYWMHEQTDEFMPRWPKRNMRVCMGKIEL